jgi:hypothetical protein
MILTRYFGEGEYSPGGFISPSGDLTITNVVVFYNSEDEAIEKIDDYLINPPQVVALKSHLKKRITPHFPLEGHKNCFTVGFEVELPLPDANYVPREIPT